MARQYLEQVEFLGIAGAGGIGDMADFVERHDLAHVPHAVDADGSLWARFGVPAQPAWVFVDDGGEAVRVLGPLGEGDLTAELDRLVAT